MEVRQQRWMFNNYAIVQGVDQIVPVDFTSRQIRRGLRC
jgi:hypothetical protein